MNYFFRTYFQAFYDPLKSFRQLNLQQNTMRLSFIYIAIPIVLYTLMYVFLAIANGAPSTFTPWLNISREKYYFFNQFILAPSMIICWLTTAAFMQVTCRVLGSKGSFEHTLTIVALSISIAMWGGLIHDLPMSFLSAIDLIDARKHEIAMNTPTIYRTLLWICYSFYFIGFMVLFPLTVKSVHKLSVSKSIAVGWSAFIIFQLLFLVFNR